MGQYVLVLYQGTTESKATLVDDKGKVIDQTECPLKPIHRKTGWVEYSPEDILKGQLNAIRAMFRKVGPKKKKQISAIGIANQPSTILLWDKSTGKPLYNAISHQDPRGIDICVEKTVHRETIHERTGLPLSPYYSASKIKWMIGNVKAARKSLEKGNLLCGTVNTYLMWHLTKGAVYATDHSNAAQTLLFNILTKTWDKEILELFAIPHEILPPVFPTSYYFGDAVIDGQTLPIHAGIVGYQASLAGTGCFEEGEVNINYGTDGSILINTGKKIFMLPGLLTTVAWSTNGSTTYILEGILNAAGSIFEWMKDSLGLISARDNLDEICSRSKGRLFMVPAIAGIGSPYWNDQMTTCLFGLRPGTKREDLIRAAVESIAFLVKDNFNVVEKDGRIPIKKIIASGPISDVAYLLQFQSDLLHMPVYKTREGDPASTGVAFLAGLSLKMWPGLSSLERFTNINKQAIVPKLSETEVKALYERWRLTCLYSKEWSKNFS